MPRYAANFLFSPLDATLQSAVGESVTLVKLEAAFVSEETPSGFWFNILDPPCRDDSGREINVVLSSWLKSNTLVLHHRELSRLTDEKAEGVVLLIKGAKGHSVGMQVKDKTQSIFASMMRPYLFPPLIPLHLPH